MSWAEEAQDSLVKRHRHREEISEEDTVYVAASTHCNYYLMLLVKAWQR